MSSITSARETVEPTRSAIATQKRRPLYGRYVATILRYAVLIPLALLFLFPFYLIVRNALMTQPEITGFEWKWWPDSPQWHNFTLLFNDPLAPMGSGLRNSAIIAVVKLVCQTLFASMAGYALARIAVPGRNIADRDVTRDRGARK